MCSLLAAGCSYYFGGDPRLVEACRGEFAGDVFSCRLVRLIFMLFHIVCMELLMVNG